MKDKKQQSVAVCVLEVLGPAPLTAPKDSKDTKGSSTPGAAAGAPASATPSAGKGAAGAGAGAASGSQPAAKRQRSMFDFVSGQAGAKPGAKTEGKTEEKGASGSGAGSSPAGTKDSLAGSSGDVLGVLREGRKAHFLLVQRPEGGLLAGLLEHPGESLSRT